MLIHTLFSKWQIADFGMSRELVVSSEYYAARGGMVPIRWAAPEVLESRKYTSASDVWSFGILCGEVFDDGEEVGLYIYLLSYLSFLLTRYNKIAAVQGAKFRGGLCHCAKWRPFADASCL